MLKWSKSFIKYFWKQRTSGSPSWRQYHGWRVEHINFMTQGFIHHFMIAHPSYPISLQIHTFNPLQIHKKPSFLLLVLIFLSAKIYCEIDDLSGIICQKHGWSLLNLSCGPLIEKLCSNGHIWKLSKCLISLLLGFQLKQLQIPS